MPVVWIPALLRPLTAGHDRVNAIGSTIAEIVADLDGQYPGLRERLCSGANLRPGLSAVVDGGVARLGMDEPIGAASEVHFVHAIGGGLVYLRM
jgi:molybdopterin synthase sulfur carrier subunit